MNGSMPGISKGFTFIELVIVIAIIGIIMTFSIPRLFQRKQPVWQTFVTELNSLVQLGSLDAMSDGKLRRIRFDFEQDKITLEVARKAAADAQDVNTEFVPAQSLQVKTVLDWPPELEMRHFFIGTTDEMMGAGVTKRVWFFIGPDGTVQDVTLVIFDTEQDRVLSLMSNPFTAQLMVYDGIKKP